MKTFLFIVLAGYAVRCDDTNYYVIQMPERAPKDFQVYWNVPTMQCQSKNILFDDLEQYGIIQNTGDTFRGDKISILYDPGDFPALLTNSSSGQIIYRNGGVPQEGSLIKHLESFQKVLEQSVPDSNFSGVGIIDFESWRPVFRQNFGTLLPYKNISYQIERKRHWWWKQAWIGEEAKRRFEVSAREFMQATIWLAKKLRPLARWGYYGFPYCFNMNSSMKETCADNVPQENDGIPWLWKESTALYPSVYSSESLTQAQLISLIRGRVREASRVAVNGAPILPYFWSRYRDNGYFSASDLNAAINTMYKSNASGFIIWGSSNDVNTLEKCTNLRQYVTDVLGPTVAKYTKPVIKLDDKLYDYTVDANEILANNTQNVETTTANVEDSIVHNIVEDSNNGTSTNESSLSVTEDPFKKNSSAAVTVPTATENNVDQSTSVTVTYSYQTTEFDNNNTIDNNNYTTTEVSDTTTNFYISTDKGSTISEIVSEGISTINPSVIEESTTLREEVSTNYSSSEESTTVREEFSKNYASIEESTISGNAGTTLAPIYTEQVVVSVV